MDLNEFEENPLNTPGLDDFEGGAGQESSQLNNPLGLSDKDMQLEYDNSMDNPKSPQEHDAEPAEEKEESQDPKADIAVEDVVESFPGDDQAVDEPVHEEETGEEEPVTKNAIPDSKEIFGSDSEDDEPIERPAARDDDNADFVPAASAQPDPDSDGGSIKSDVDRNDMPMSDFDLMMEQKSQERKRAFRRRKGAADSDLINDHDDRIQEIIVEMKKAADDDRKANQRNECAFSKLKMLPTVIHALQKQDLQTAFLDCGILSALADWLAPLPDGNLTHLKIRESILKLIGDFSGISPDQLKNSGIGKAVMLLYKHPKEMKENRAKAGKLIQEWSRPIFGTSANYKSMTREEREERDLELLAKRQQNLETPDRPAKKRKSSHAAAGDAGDEEGEGDDPNRDIPRARVPQPSLKDYVIRPKSNFSMDTESSGGRRSAGPKSKNRFDKKIRDMKDQSRPSKSMGNHISVAGNKM